MDRNEEVMFYFLRNLTHPRKVWVCKEERFGLEMESFMLESLSLQSAVAKYGYCEVR